MMDDGSRITILRNHPQGWRKSIPFKLHNHRLNEKTICRTLLLRVFKFAMESSQNDGSFSWSINFVNPRTINLKGDSKLASRYMSAAANRRLKMERNRRNLVNYNRFFLFIHFNMTHNFVFTVLDLADLTDLQVNFHSIFVGIKYLLTYSREGQLP